MRSFALNFFSFLFSYFPTKAAFLASTLAIPVTILVAASSVGSNTSEVQCFLNLENEKQLNVPEGVKSVPLAEIPFELHGHLIFLQGRVNDRPVSLVLNNGEPISLLSMSFVKSARLQQRGASKKVMTAAGWERRWPLCETAIGLGGVSFIPSKLNGVSLPADPPIQGVLGADLFERFVVELNFTEKKVLLYEPKTYQPRNQGQTLDMRICNGLPLIKAAFPQSNQAPAKGDFVMLLSHPSTLWLSPHFQKERQLKLLNMELHPTNPLPAKSTSKLRRGYLEQIQVGSHIIDKPNVTIGAIPRNLPSTAAGIFGFRLLQCFDLVFDYSRQQIIAQTNANFIQARKKGFSWNWKRPLLEFSDGDFYLNLCGAELSSNNLSSNTFQIRRIEPGSAADRAGMRKNDLLLSLDGQTLTKQSLLTLMQTLGQAGRLCHMELRRDEQRISVTMVVNWMLE